MQHVPCTPAVIVVSSHLFPVDDSTVQQKRNPTDPAGLWNPERKAAIFTPLKKCAPRVATLVATADKYPLVAFYDLQGGQLYYSAPNEARV